MRKNVIIGFLLLTNIIFGVACYLQKIKADTHIAIAERYYVRVQEHAKRAVELELIAKRNAEEAEKQQMLAEQHMAIVAQHLKQAGK